MAQRRREHLWAWLTLGTLVLCWDASMRLDQRVPIPRARIEHAGDPAEVLDASLSASGQP